MPVLLVAALGQPIAGIVFVLDGVLIGAGDGTYLAWGGWSCWRPTRRWPWRPWHSAAAWSAVWVAFAASSWVPGCVVLAHRARGDAWLVTGASTGPTSDLPCGRSSPSRWAW